MSDVREFRDFLVLKGCPGTSRELTKVLMWLQKEDVTCPEDLTHLRNLSHFNGVGQFRCDTIAFIDSLIGDGEGLGVPIQLAVEDTDVVPVPLPKKARQELPKYVLLLCL